jgi:phosphatidylserine/phosphatidylglycerophosphate/cardiolipin synthase-like enzyme
MILRLTTILLSLCPVFSFAQQEFSEQNDHTQLASVLFHPSDATLEKIAGEIANAKHSVDIAMYNIDVSDTNPIIKRLKDPSVRSRLDSGTLIVRMIFEGYGSKQEVTARSKTLEDLGIDVRWLNSGKHVHHKFAVIDAGTDTAQVITGSANWSLSSWRNYQENILFFPEHPCFAEPFSGEFDFLWSISSDFGLTKASQPPIRAICPSNARVYFNSDNFSVRNGTLIDKPAEEGFVLTRKLVQSIDNATSKISVATTRILLRPVYDAILRAAARGVKVNVVVNMDQYQYPSARQKTKLPDCPDAFATKCSRDQNYSWFLVSGSYPGRENVNVRVWFFNLNIRAALLKQMHHKYVVIDNNLVLTGSFNWSYSAEYDHIENMIEFSRDGYAPLVDTFLQRQKLIFESGREGYLPFVERLDTALKQNVPTDCTFAPMALTFEEIDYLLATGERNGKPLKEACVKS